MNTNQLKGKKLLILGGIALSKEIVKHAQQLGIEVSVTDYLEGSPAKKIANKSFMVSTTDVEALSELVQKEQFDGILTGFVDLLLPYYEETCRQNNLPCYLNKEQNNILTDKIKFKELCRKFDIPVVEEYSLDSLDNVEMINSFKYPILLKPADNSGGRGITICKTADEFTENFEKSISFSKSNQVLIERYMEAKEVTIFYMIQNGNVKLTGMGDRHVQHFKEGLIPLPVAYSLPSIYLEEYEKNLHPKVVDMFKNLGMKDGMVFIQSFVEDGKCVFYEIGYRLTGSLEYKLIEHASGFNPMNMMIEHAVTGEYSVDIDKLANPNFDKHYCNITFLANPGKIDKIIGVKDILDTEGVLDVFVSYNEGDEIPKSALGTLAQVVARVFAYADTKEGLIKVMDDVHNKFEVLSEKGESMTLPFFDTNLLFT